MDANEIVTAITERVRDAANVNVVFGDPVETAGGVTIIPVASIKVSGGGTGRSRRSGEGGEAAAGTDRGMGLGGMGLGVKVMAKPLGYIEIKGDNARFVPIPDVTRIAVGGMFVTGLTLLTANRFLRFKKWSRRQMLWRGMQALRRRRLAQR
jgi:uncharacterized spore protein YtfJ